MRVAIGFGPKVRRDVKSLLMEDGVSLVMEHPTEIAILDKMLDPVARCLTPEVAKQIAELRADASTQTRIDELATKCNEGELTEAEQREYGAYVDAIDLIGLLQAKARVVLARQLNS